MSPRHALKYHLVIPAAIFGALVVIGVPLGTSFFIAMMSGCMSMMLMMGRGTGATAHRDNSPRPGTGGDDRPRLR